MATVTGTADGENLSDDTTKNDDLVYALGGNDTVNAKDGNDTVYGGEGDDTINGQDGNDTLYGEAGDDTINGGKGSDTLIGGEGDDTLSGGEGGGQDVPKNDTFKYSFTVDTGASQSSSFTGWLAANDYSSAVSSNGEVADGTTQAFFSVQYTAWLNELVSTYGLGEDKDGDGKVSVGLNQNDPNGTPYIEGMSEEDLASMFGDRENVMLKTGKTTQERYYSDSFTFGSGTTVSSTDGKDIINDFSRTDGDKLDFSGLTSDQFNSFFSVNVVDADGDTFLDDTVITLTTDATWSLTLIGYTSFDAAQDVTFA